MKEVFVNHFLNYLKKNNVCDSKQEKIFKYTLESLYSFITKSIVILVLSIFLHTFFITFTLLIFYSFLRGFTFGIHATKNIYCWIISLTVYVVCPYLIYSFHFPTYFIYSSYVLGILSILLWAPADTKARPLLNPQKRKINKIISFIILCGFIAISFAFNSQTLEEIVSIVSLLNFICICPVTYYLFKQPYRNYRFYKPKLNVV